MQVGGVRPRAVSEYRVPGWGREGREGEEEGERR